MVGECILDPVKQLFGFEGLGQHIVGTLTEGLDGHFDRGIRRDHDHRDFGIAVAYMAEHFQTIHFGHFDIGNDQIIIPGAEFGDCLDRICEGFDLVVLVPQYGLHHSAETDFVIDEQNSSGLHQISSRVRGR